MIATAIVYAAIALTGFGCGWWCASYLGTWRLQKLLEDERRVWIYNAGVYDASQELVAQAVVTTIRKCMEKTP